MTNTLKFLLVLSSLFLVYSCNVNIEEEEDIDIDDGRHPEYYENVSFNNRNFEYFEYNLRAIDGDEVRTEEEMHDHRVEVTYDAKNTALTLKFKNFPQTEKHYWAWFEVTDIHKNEVYREAEIPEKEIKDFQTVFSPAVPFEKRVRIRCFCQVHGEFIEYFDIPEEEKEEVQELELDTEPQ